MAEKLKNEDLEEKINKFLEDKGINNSLCKESITKFIKGHNREFGNIISTEDVIERLYQNLDKITFVGRTRDAYGEYVKKDKNFKDKNEILIYEFKSTTEYGSYIRDDMPDDVKERGIKKYENKVSEMQSVIIHELTHAAYTKVNEKGDIEHVFTLITEGENFFDDEDRRMQLGNSNFVEGIVNYIARETEGKTDEDGLNYRYQTKTIYLLAYRMGNEKLIKSAWDSNEELFKKTYMEIIKKPEEEAKISYDAFNEDMGQLKLIEKEGIDFFCYIDQSMRYTNHIEDLINGKTYLPMGQTKSGLEDVINVDNIIISVMDRATKYVTQKYNQIKEAIKGILQFKEDEDDTGGR